MCVEGRRKLSTFKGLLQAWYSSDSEINPCRETESPSGRRNVEVLLESPSLIQSEVRELLTLAKVQHHHILHSMCAKYRFFLFFLFHSISRTSVTSGNKIGYGNVERRAYCLLFHTIDHFTSISLFLLSRFYASVPCPSRFVISKYCRTPFFCISYLCQMF